MSRKLSGSPLSGPRLKAGKNGFKISTQVYIMVRNCRLAGVGTIIIIH